MKVLFLIASMAIYYFGIRKIARFILGDKKKIELVEDLTESILKSGHKNHSNLMMVAVAISLVFDLTYLLLLSATVGFTMPVVAFVVFTVIASFIQYRKAMQSSKEKSPFKLSLKLIKSEYSLPAVMVSITKMMFVAIFIKSIMP